MKPALDEQKLQARLLRDLEQQGKRDFGNVLAGLVHKSMIPVMIRRTGIPSDTKAAAVTREQRRRLLQELKCFSVRIDGSRAAADDSLVLYDVLFAGR